jgi:hypothetical protein
VIRSVARGILATHVLARWELPACATFMVAGDLVGAVTDAATAAVKVAGGLSTAARTIRNYRELRTVAETAASGAQRAAGGAAPGREIRTEGEAYARPAFPCAEDQGKTPTEAAKIIGIGRTTLYGALQRAVA